MYAFFQKIKKLKTFFPISRYHDNQIKDKLIIKHNQTTMTATIRTDTSTTSTSSVNRGRTQTRRLTSVPAGCDDWEKKLSFGRKDFNYASNPHGRSHTRKKHSETKNTSAKSRRARKNARELKHFTRSEALCEEDREKFAAEDDEDPVLNYVGEPVEDEGHAEGSFERAKSEFQHSRAAFGSVLPPPEYIDAAVEPTLTAAAPPAPPVAAVTTVSEEMYCVNVTGEGDDMKLKAVPMQSRSQGIVVKFGSDFCFAADTYKYEMCDGTSCLVRRIKGEWLVMPCDHFMDNPEDINDDDVWVKKAIAYILFPRLPENPQCEDIVGSCEIIMHEDPDDDWRRHCW